MLKIASSDAIVSVFQVVVAVRLLVESRRNVMNSESGVEAGGMLVFCLLELSEA